MPTKFQLAVRTMATSLASSFFDDTPPDGGLLMGPLAAGVGAARLQLNSLSGVSVQEEGAKAAVQQGGTALAFALGGSSDVIGALAWARAFGFERVVLVQPGSPPRGTESPTLELQPVQSAEAGAAAPGGNFFDNGSMVAYLLSLDQRQLVAGYYLVQPKDDGGYPDRGSNHGLERRSSGVFCCSKRSGAVSGHSGKGFSPASLEGTTAALTHALTTHGCTALLGLDFGGDVALPDEAKQHNLCKRRPCHWDRALIVRPCERVSPCQASQALSPAGRAGRTSSSATGSTCWPPLPQPSSAASRRGGPPVSPHMPPHLHCISPTPPQARLIAASPGVDAAAVAPEYERMRRSGGAARVLEMDREGVLRELTDTAPPACTLPELPAALFPHRHDAALERRFCAELCTLDERIMADVPAEKRGEHASKTYHMLVCAAEAARSAPPGDGFFTLGQFRSAEKARAHLHSSYATGIYDLGHLAPA